MTSHDDFRLKRALDALPRELEPGSPDLWPGIRAAITSVPADDRHTAPHSLNRLAPARLRVAALLLMLGASAGALALSRHAAGQWHLIADGGNSRLFEVGEDLATRDGTARLAVGKIGTVDVAHETDVRLLSARWSTHRLALSRGTIHARIDAPPRLFIVETPSGTAVDLGCEYTLGVDSLGTSTLVVTSGWVSFEDGGRESLIPAGMRSITRRGRVVGTPFRDDAPGSLRAALAAFDAGDHRDTVISDIVRRARPSDAITLWHVAKRTESGQQARVFTRLTELAPTPRGLTAAQVLADDRMMRLYWTTLPGSAPIVSGWQETLWRLWARIFG
ncbi:MAG: hypothetical protein V4550_17600 [Gemmatimonadota bacterium]